MLTKPLTARAWAESIEKDLEAGESDADFGFVGDVKSIDPSSSEAARRQLYPRHRADRNRLRGQYV